MAQDTPEEIGQELAEMLDLDALHQEAEANGEDGLLEEILQAYSIIFNENSPESGHIQHRLLEAALDDALESMHHPENLTKDGLVDLARDYAQEALYAFANEVTDRDPHIPHQNLPDDKDETGERNEYYSFWSVVVDSFWSEVATDRIEQYAE